MDSSPPSSAASKAFSRASEDDVLSIDLLQEVCGNEDLETVEEIEVIFNPICEMSNLDRCVNLRSISLIGVGLKRISNLACVGHSLERLSLSENALTKIEGLYLPNLRELYLHNNSICRLEGLEGCPKLQRLWLTENRIVKLENLQCLGDLREFCLQCNKISRIQNLEHLVNLECFELAGNRIADFKDLQRLAHLPAMRSLSLVDPDYGANPITSAEGYREFVLCTLKQVLTLDAVGVTANARAVAEDVYMQRVLNFNDRVEQVRRGNERELLAIEARRQRNVANSDSLRKDLQNAFAELENTIQDGRARISAEHSRQLRVRKANLNALQKSLNDLRRQHGHGIERLVSDEEVRIQAEEQWYRLEHSKITAEKDEAVFLASVRPRKGATREERMKGISCQELSEHVPDYRFIAAHFRASATEAASGDGKKGGGSKNGDDPGGPSSASSSAASGGKKVPLRRLSIVKVYKLFSQFQYEAYRAACLGTPGAPADPAEAYASPPGGTERLYFGGSHSQIHHIIKHGFFAVPKVRGGGATEDVLVLHTDPVLAVERSFLGDKVAGDADVGQAGKVYVALLCRVAIGQRHTLYGTRSQALDPPADLLSQLPPESHSGQVNYGSGSGAGAYYVIRPEHAARIIPESFLLIQEVPKKRAGGVSLTGVKLEQMLSELTLPGDTSGPGREAHRVHADFERRVLKEMQRYEQRVAQEMDPETASQLQETEAEVGRLRDTLQGLRKQIDTEKEMQERILRDFRAQYGGSVAK
jgi:hypothetical protein